MIKVNTLLPSNATQLERAFNDAGASRLSNVKIDFRQLWNPETCEENLLPWLAYALGVEEWDATWPLAYKRDVVSTIRAIRRKKGTLGAVKRALASLGHENAEVIERYGYAKYDGQIRHDGSRLHGGADEWATFAVFLKRPVSIKQAELIKNKLLSVKRNCVWLVVLDFTSALLHYDATIKYDGTYTHGRF